MEDNSWTQVLHLGWMYEEQEWKHGAEADGGTMRTWKLSYCTISFNAMLQSSQIMLKHNTILVAKSEVDLDLTSKFVFCLFKSYEPYQMEFWHSLILWETFCKYSLSEINKFKLKDLSEVLSWNATNTTKVLWAKFKRFAISER